MIKSDKLVAQEISEGFQALLDAYDSVTCAASDCMDRMNAMFSDMKSIAGDVRMSGTALTVKTIAGDLSAVVYAVEQAQEGDIIVVDAHESKNTAFWGENITLSAMNKGVKAAIIDGATRDVEEIRKLHFPVMSRGICPNVGCMAGYGVVGTSIQCAGVQVNPNDIIVIDGNGVVIVPFERGREILDKTRKMMETEYLVSEKIKNGDTIGKLININKIMTSTFAYQERALEE